MERRHNEKEPPWGEALFENLVEIMRIRPFWQVVWAQGLEGVPVEDSRHHRCIRLRRQGTRRLRDNHRRCCILRWEGGRRVFEAVADRHREMTQNPVEAESCCSSYS